MIDYCMMYLLNQISFDKFGSWVKVDNFNVRDENRRFYLSKYRNLMDGKFLFRNVKVEKVMSKYLNCVEQMR